MQRDDIENTDEIIDWAQEIRLCRKKKPDCSKCPVDDRINCKYHEDLHYDRVIYDRKIHIVG